MSISGYAESVFIRREKERKHRSSSNVRWTKADYRLSRFGGRVVRSDGAARLDEIPVFFFSSLFRGSKEKRRITSLEEESTPNIVRYRGKWCCDRVVTMSA